MAYSIINDISVSGTIAATAQNVFLNISGHSAGSVQITGTWVGTMGFEGTTDGTTWLPINGVSAASSAPTPNAAANALYRITPGGLTSFRIVSSAWTSGTAVITIRASSGVAGVFANQILPARITDGTNTTSIKPASTAAAATDIPLVVALHPSSTTPNFAAAQPVSGTFFQATQPISGTVAANATLSAETTKVIGTVNVAGTVPVSGAFFQTTQPISAATLPLPTGAAQDGTDITTPTAMPAGGLGIRGWLSSIWTKLNGSLAVTGAFFQTTQPVSLAANTPVIAAGANAIGNINELRAATLAVTVTAAAATAATLTLPAVAGQFHYITAIDIVLYSAAARTGAAAPTVVTSTNLPGAVAFTFSTAGAIGTTDVQDLIRVTPLKSSVVNTATTIVAPIAAGGIWRITATYFTAP